MSIAGLSVALFIQERRKRPKKDRSQGAEVAFEQYDNMTFAYYAYRSIKFTHHLALYWSGLFQWGAIMDRRRFAGSVVHEGDHFDYVVECEANEHGMTWFATVFRGAEIRGHPNGILDGVEIEHPDIRGLLNDIVGKSIRDRVGVRI